MKPKLTWGVARSSTLKIIKIVLLTFFRVICLSLHPGTTDTDLSKPYQVHHLGGGCVTCYSNMHNIIIFESLLLGELVFRKIHTRIISSTRKLLMLIISLVFFLWPF